MQATHLQGYLRTPSLFQARFFGAGINQAFGTQDPGESSRYHRGLFHQKKHGQRRQRCFSMKYSIQTMKPNVARKTLYSETLDTSFRLYISMKARRCIMKAGSFDNYLLNTKPDIIDSRLGLHIRGLIKQAQRDPNFAMPYVPGQASMPKTKQTKNWMYRNTPAIYMPTNVKMSEDHSKYYIKTPQEMSRYEIQELERELKALSEEATAE